MKERYVFVFLNRALNKQGTSVIEAESEEEAWGVFREHHQPFCMVLSINGRKVS